MAKKSGISVKDLYWTLGKYDVIAICEAPDDETATAFSLSVCSRGNVRSWRSNTSGMSGNGHVRPPSASVGLAHREGRSRRLTMRGCSKHRAK